MRAPAAVLWDMDGTIVDTESYFIDSARAIVEREGGLWTPGLAHDMIGANLWDMAEKLRAAGANSPSQIIVAGIVESVRLLIQEDIPWRPGARELLAEVHAAGIPMALVTMSFRSIAEVVAAAVPLAAFELIIAGDDVRFGKPHPEAYLTAADRLGVPIEACVAIEDSPPGVEAAVASGAFVIAVPYQAVLPDVSQCVVWDNLVGRSLADLMRVQAVAHG